MVNFIVLSGELGERTHIWMINHELSKMRAKGTGVEWGNETIQSLSFNSSIYTAVYFPFEVQKFVVQINREFLFPCKIHRTHSTRKKLQIMKKT